MSDKAAPPSAKAAAEQFDKEFQRYTTKQVKLRGDTRPAASCSLTSLLRWFLQTGKSARAVAMTRAELAKYNALVFQDKKLEEAGVKKGRLSPETRAAYEKRVKDLEAALDAFHTSVAGYNRNKALLSFALLAAFALIMFFQPWKKHFVNDYDDYAALEEEPVDVNGLDGVSDEL
ncbi:hypothetical protein BBJ28_00021739 [Nothophytophthora sp. Chile5]|nr:hypothetical protein BBJ28_00021739 [Nothophytophthora sp. Chile5]